MGYRAHCDWCGEYIALVDQDYAKLSVKIHRRRQTKLRTDWAEEVRPTLFFCVNEVEDRDRLGLEDEVDDHGSCYARAVASIEGRETETPDLGMEWRLVPVGASITERPPPAAVAPAEVSADAGLSDFLEGLKPSPRSKLGRALAGASISTLDQVAALSDDDLMAIPGVGWATRCRLRAFIAAKGAAGAPAEPSRVGDA